MTNQNWLDDATVQSLGFANMEEFFWLTAAPDLNQTGAFERFKQWKSNDGTKAGLLAAFPDIALKEYAEG